MLRWTLPAAVCLLLVLPSAFAGTEASPEITDVAGDAPGPLDVTSVWITSDAGNVTFHVKVANLGAADPLLGGPGARYAYRVSFHSSTSQRNWSAQGQVCEVETTSRGVVLTPPPQVYSHSFSGYDASASGTNGVGACAGTTASASEDLLGDRLTSAGEQPNTTAAYLTVDPAANLLTLRVERQENFVLIADTVHRGVLEPMHREVGLGAGTVIDHVTVETLLGESPLVDNGRTGSLDGGGLQPEDVAGPAASYALG